MKCYHRKANVQYKRECINIDLWFESCCYRKPINSYWPIAAQPSGHSVINIPVENLILALQNEICSACFPMRLCTEHVMQRCSRPATRLKGALLLSHRLAPFPYGPYDVCGAPVEHAVSWSAVFMDHCRYHFHFPPTFGFVVHSLQPQAWITHSLFMAFVFLNQGIDTGTWMKM